VSGAPPTTPAPTAAGPLTVFFDPALSKIGILEPGGLGLPGEALTWVFTLTNVGNGVGTNVVVTDTLRPELRIDGADTDWGSVVSINGQTVTFTFPVVNVGQTFQFRIRTTVISSPLDGTIPNLGILTADGNIRREARAVIFVPTGLPNTGHPPQN
jgi:hypothetical protein